MSLKANVRKLWLLHFSNVRGTFSSILFLQELLGLRFVEINNPHVWNKDIQMVSNASLIITLLF